MARGGGMGILFSPLDEGGTALMDKLRLMETRMADMEIPLAVTVEGFHKLESEILNNDGGSNSWAPLADTTVMRKASGGFAPQTMLRTGDLMASFLDGAQGVEMISPFLAIVGSDVKYAAFQQEGVESHNMPARDLLPSEGALMTLLVAAIQGYLLTGVATAASDSVIAGLA